MKAFVVVAALAVVVSAIPLPDCDCDPEAELPGALPETGLITPGSFNGPLAIAGPGPHGLIPSIGLPAAAAIHAAPALGYGYAAAAPSLGYGYAAAAPSLGYGYAAAAHVAVQAAPAISYAATAPAIIKQNIEIPVTKTVHYADQQIVTGHTTTIHKPTINAPAIAAPRTLIGKTITNPATLSVQKYAAEVKTINRVPQPFDVPYDVPVPFAVPTPVQTAPVHLRKRVYAPAAYAGAAYAAAAPVAYAAHAPVAYAGHAAISAATYGAFPGAIGLNFAAISADAEDAEDCDCD